MNITVEQVIGETKAILMNINVPVWLADQIAKPIKDAIGNLDLCLDAFERDRESKSADPQEHVPPEEFDAVIEEITPVNNEP